MTPDEKKILDGFLKDLSKAEKPHADRCQFYKACDQAYHAKQPRNRDSTYSFQNQENARAPYAFQAVDTIQASLVDDRPGEKVKPLRQSESCREGAEMHEHLDRYQRKRDRFDAKQPRFVQSGLIRGIAVAKIPWVYERAMVSRPVMTPPAEGVQPQKTTTKPEMETVFDQPSWVNVDAMHFMWNPDAIEWPEEIRYCFHRTYETLDQLKLNENYSNTDELAPKSGGGTGGAEGPGAEPAMGRCEVIERWSVTPTGIHLTTVADRKVVLQDCASPFTHNKLPFVVFTPLPQHDALEGTSNVAIIAGLQASIWGLTEQQMLNVRYSNIAGQTVIEGQVNTEELQKFPGVVIPVKDHDDIRQFPQPPDMVTQLAASIQQLKGDIQNVSPANAYVSGADNSVVDNKTATGIQAVQSMAQLRIQAMKRNLSECYRQAGLMRIQLNEQLWSAFLQIQVDDSEWVTVTPEALIGEFDYDVEDVAENLNQQQRRAEANAKVQTLLALATTFPGLVDGSKVLADFSEGWDDAPDKYLAPPPAPMPMAPPPGSQPGSLVPGFSPGLSPGGIPGAAPIPSVPAFGQAPEAGAAPLPSLAGVS